LTAVSPHTEKESSPAGALHIGELYVTKPGFLSDGELLF
jgi:hypothetical protein